jgi:hypothetical protein
MKKLPGGMYSNVFPPSVLSSSTPPSKPRLGFVSDASRLKFCRKVKRANPPSKKSNRNESSRLSLTTAGSSMDAALGGVSAGGTGTPEFEVTQSGGEPCAFVAAQFGGSAGGVTLSKLSLVDNRNQQRGHSIGAGETAARISTRPQPATLFGGPGVPHCL